MVPGLGFLEAILPNRRGEKKNAWLKAELLENHTEFLKNVSRQFRGMLLTPADFSHSSERAEDVMEINENVEVALENAYDQLPMWCREPDEKSFGNPFYSVNIAISPKLF